MVDIGDVVVPEGPVEIFDNVPGLEIYAEAVQDIFLAGKNLSISFYSPRLSPSGKAYRVVVGRIAMPPDGVADMAVRLLDFLDRAKIELPNASKS